MCEGGGKEWMQILIGTRVIRARENLSLDRNKFVQFHTVGVRQKPGFVHTRRRNILRDKNGP